jgi:hypothetical protein
VSHAPLVPRSFHETVHGDLIRALTWENGAALGSRTPDLRITSTPNPAFTVLLESIRARRSVHHAQNRTPENSIGGHEGGHAGDRQGVPSGWMVRLSSAYTIFTTVATAIEPTHSRCVVRGFEATALEATTRPGQSAGSGCGWPGLAGLSAECNSCGPS